MYNKIKQTIKKGLLAAAIGTGIMYATPTFAQTVESASNTTTASAPVTLTQVKPAKGKSAVPEQMSFEERYTTAFPNGNNDVPKEKFQVYGFPLRDANGDQKIDNLPTLLNVWRGPNAVSDGEYIIQSQKVEDNKLVPDGSPINVGLKDGKLYVVENEQFKNEFVPDASKRYTVKGSADWMTINAHEFPVYTKQMAERAGLDKLLEGKTPMVNYFWAVQELPVKDGTKFTVKKYETMPKLVNGKLEAVSGKKEEIDVDTLQFGKIKDGLSAMILGTAQNAGSNKFSGNFARGFADYGVESWSSTKEGRNGNNKSTKYDASGIMANAEGQYLFGNVVLNGAGSLDLLKGDANVDRKKGRLVIGYTDKKSFALAAGIAATFENLKNQQLIDNYIADVNKGLLGPAFIGTLYTPNGRVKAEVSLQNGTEDQVVRNSALPGLENKFSDDKASLFAGDLDYTHQFGKDVEADVGGKFESYKANGANSTTFGGRAGLAVRLIDDFGVNANAEYGVKSGQTNVKTDYTKLYGGAQFRF